MLFMLTCNRSRQFEIQLSSVYFSLVTEEDPANWLSNSPGIAQSATGSEGSRFTFSTIGITGLRIVFTIGLTGFGMDSKAVRSGF